jgi:LysM repeat protein
MKQRSNFSIFRLRRLIALIGAVWTIGALAAGNISPATVVAQGRNLLKNPGFEGDYQVQCSFPGGKPWLPVECNGVLPSMPWQTVQMAPGWVGWWQPPNQDKSDPDFYRKFPSYCGSNAPDDCVAWHQPEFRDTRAALQDPPRIRSGENSQKYFSFWSVHQGGVYQVVDGVRPGTPLRFSIYMMAWSATKMDDSQPNPHQSFGQTNMHLKIGIDPTGGTDPWSSEIVWSAEKESYDVFGRYEVQAIARSTKVTVFTHSRPENPMQHNDLYLDDAELTLAGGMGSGEPLTVNPPPALQAVGVVTMTTDTGGRITHVIKPGDTLFALALQYGVPVDQIMALNGLKAESQVQIGRELIIALAAPRSGPSAVLAPLASVSGPAGSGRGTVCIQAFADADADGRRLRVEAPVASSGLHFIVTDAQGATVADRVMDESTPDTCVADLPATTYRVVAEPPPGYAATMPTRWSIALPSDTRIDLQLGLRAAPIEPPSPWPIVAAGGLMLAAVVGVTRHARQIRSFKWRTI